MSFLKDRNNLSDFYGLNDFKTFIDEGTGELYVEPFDMMQTFQRIMYEIGLLHSPLGTTYTH